MDDMRHSIFISYRFEDLRAAQFKKVVTEVAAKLRKLSVIDGNDLQLRETSGFSVNIIDFIRREADCIIAILTESARRDSNILYEIGVAVGAGKDVIIVAEKLDLVPSMIKHRGIFCPNSNIDWLDEFRKQFEGKLRFMFQLEDHFIENKLQRRYSYEERRHMVDPSHAELAMLCNKTGDFKKAEAVIEEALKRDSRDMDMIFLLSESFYLSGCTKKDPEARELLFQKQLDSARRGLDINPDSVLCLNSRGAAHMRLGEFKLAYENFNRLLSVDKNFSIGHYNLACLHALAGNKAGMLDSLTTSISLNPDWKIFAKEDPDFLSYYQDSDWLNLVD